MKTREQITAELNVIYQAAKGIGDQIRKEGREFTPDERVEVNRYLAKAQLLTDELSDLNGENEKARQKARDEAILDQVRDLGGDMPGNRGSKNGGKPGPWAKAFFKGRPAYGQKEFLTPSGSVGVPALSQTVPALGERVESVLQVLPVTPTSNSSIEYLREVTRTQNAAPVAAKGTKPTSVYELQEIDDPVEVIAHLSEPIPRNYLSDYGNLRRYLDTVLRQGTQLEVENQIFNGSSVSPDLTGMLIVSGHVEIIPDGSDILSLARQGITVIENLSLPTSGLVYAMSPNVWETYELLTDTGGRYYYKMNEGSARAPVNRQQRTLWGAPVALSVSMPDDRILLFHRQAVELFEREQATIDWSENTISIVDGTPVSDFARNLVRFRCEGRYALAIYNPSGIVEIIISEGS